MIDNNNSIKINFPIIFIVFGMIMIFSSIQFFSQEKADKKEILKAIILKVPNSTQAANNTIDFKNSSGAPIITITDEGGRNGGSITLPPISSSTIFSTFNKLYNHDGILKFNGTAIGADGGADSINQLIDAQYDGSSLFLGNGAGTYDDGGNFNTAVGKSSLALNTTGVKNTSIGYSAHNKNTTGSFNSAIGYQTLFRNTVGSVNTAIGTLALHNNTIGSSNTALGYQALVFNTTGNNNVSLGNSANYYNQAGSNNTLIGYEAGRGTSSHNKSGNIFIGYQAGYYETGDNKLYIENSNSSSPLIYGDFASDDVQINGNLEVTETTQIGNTGVPITEIKLLTGSLSTSSFATVISYPSGYNQSNSYLLSCKVGPPSGSGAIWENVGKFSDGNDRSLQVSFTETNIVVLRENSGTNNLDYKMVLMKIE